MELSKRTHEYRETHTPFQPWTMNNYETHSIVRVTLSGPALVGTILTLVLCIHLFQPSLTATLVALAPLPYIIRNDYKAFLSLGPGGTPSTFPGYLKITYLRMFALKDPYTPPPVLGIICPSTGRFRTSSSSLPLRSGARPTVKGIAPQRQIDQPGSGKAYHSLRRALSNAAASHPDRLFTGTSCFEKKGLALFAKNPLNSTCRGEICHVHHIDRSLHLNLHPEDAKVVLEQGWGQRHPLAKGGWFSRFVPKEFLMIYAPRDLDECEVVARIIGAAAWWVTGGKVDIEVPEVTAEEEDGMEMEIEKMGMCVTHQKCEPERRLVRQ
jgi:hypothetical protein